MKNRIIALVVGMILLLVASLVAQAPDTLWTRTYGGTDLEWGSSISQTSDGGYIIAGNTESFGAGMEDYYLLKINSNGDTIWTKTYGGTGSDYGAAVLQASDQGFVMTGWTYSFGMGESDVWLVKTDTIGNIEWTKTYGGTEHEMAHSMQKTYDNCYVITGASGEWFSRDVYLIKIDTLGDTLWTRRYGGTGIDIARFVQQNSDSGYIIVGSSESFGAGSSDLYLLRTNQLGDTLWTRTFGSADYDIGTAVMQTSEGGFLAAGFAETPTGYTDIYLVKIDENGDSIWTKSYGAQYYDFCNAIISLNNDEFVIAGGSELSNPPWGDFYLAKIDSIGNVIWENTYGGDSIDEAFAVQATFDGGYILVGYTESFGGGSYDIYVVKTEPGVGIGEHPDQIYAFGDLRVITHPNPFAIATTICLSSMEHGAERLELQIFDVTGRKVREISLLPSRPVRESCSNGVNFSLGVTWDGCDDAGQVLPPGIYFLKLNGKLVGKVVKVR
jgi:hypothetical protein